MPHVTVPRNKSTARNGVRKFDLAPQSIVTINGIRCTTGTQTMLDLAAILDDLQWEQTLESALRKRLTTINDIHRSLSQRRVC